MAPNKETITVIVNGVATVVEQNANAPLKSIIGKALEQTGNQGRQQEDWELRDEGGNVLDLDRKIGDYHFPPGTKLFLNLKAGIGG